jgi:hypothetical protein
MSGSYFTAAVVEEHKVSTGESLESIASEHGLSWQQLAEFNCGSSDAKKVNQHLREVVGCTKLTQDGKSYILDDSDDPGLLLIPQKDWGKEGLPVNHRHTFRVLKSRTLLLRLQDAEGHRIPDTSYEIVFADDSHQQGRLGRAGIGLIRNPPEGPFAVYYPDHHDVIAKSLAACCRDAISEGSTEEIFRLLQHPPEIIHSAIAAYDEYFNDYSGKGLIEDIYAVVTDEDALAAVEGLMAYAGLATREEIVVMQRLEQAPAC